MPQQKLRMQFWQNCVRNLRTCKFDLQVEAKNCRDQPAVNIIMQGFSLHIPGIPWICLPVRTPLDPFGCIGYFLGEITRHASDPLLEEH
jgi:hypothetical protein